jgi:hypothetical protein
VVSGLETLEPFALPVGGLGRTESCVDGHQWTSSRGDVGWRFDFSADSSLPTGRPALFDVVVSWRVGEMREDLLECDREVAYAYAGRVEDGVVVAVE